MTGQGIEDAATVRAMRSADVPAVVAIERSAFTTPWSIQTFAALLGRPRAEMLVLEVPGAVADLADECPSIPVAETTAVAIARAEPSTPT